MYVLQGGVAFNYLTLYQFTELFPFLCKREVVQTVLLLPCLSSQLDRIGYFDIRRCILHAYVQPEAFGFKGGGTLVANVHANPTVFCFVEGHSFVDIGDTEPIPQVHRFQLLVSFIHQLVKVLAESTVSFLDVSDVPEGSDTFHEPHIADVETDELTTLRYGFVHQVLSVVDIDLLRRDSLNEGFQHSLLS